MSWGDSFMECDVPSSKRARLPATPSSVDGALALGGTIAKSEKVGINRKQGENLDYRLRVVEAHIFDSFRVNTDQLTHPLWRTIAGGKSAWNAAKEPKKEHKWKAERLTLALCMLKVLSVKRDQQQFDNFFAPVMNQILAYDAIASPLGAPTIAQQMNALAAFGASISNEEEGRERVSQWVNHLQFTETKKGDAYLLRVGFQASSLMAGARGAVCLSLLAAGAIPLDGTAPPNPHFHRKEKKRE